MRDVGGPFARCAVTVARAVGAGDASGLLVDRCAATAARRARCGCCLCGALAAHSTGGPLGSPMLALGGQCRRWLVRALLRRTSRRRNGECRRRLDRRSSVCSSCSSCMEPMGASWSPHAPLRDDTRFLRCSCSLARGESPPRDLQDGMRGVRAGCGRRVTDAPKGLMGASVSSRGYTPGSYNQRPSRT